MSEHKGDGNSEVWTVLGLDPGGTTGYAFLKYDPLEVTAKRLEYVDVGEFAARDFNLWLRRYLPLCTHVACEDFVMRPQVAAWKNTGQISNNLTTAKLVGRVELAADWLNKKLFKYEAHEKEFFYKLNGMTYVKGKKNMHRYDAMAHARGCLRRERGI